ncbi:MAG: 23S rRNA (pseudouridine(1915)-N(3))-methyltransferase RlmH [Bacillota bacterium]
MQIEVLAVGKIKENYLKKGIEEYLKRLQPYAKLNIIEISEEKLPSNPSPKDEEEVKNKEGDRILARLKEDTFIAVLDKDGDMPTSEGLAEKLQQLMVSGKSHLTIIIGGSLGLPDRVLKRADIRLSFGKLTYPHQLMRLIVLEQIYRCFKIIRGEPYHK